MKSFREVESGRRDYHRDGALNSVHRSSLTVPEISGSEVEISFINHFLLKRGYQSVGCRITAIDQEGRRIESRLLTIDEPRVYTIPLTGMVDAPAASYIVEFYADKNLYIPFPAVMVNHRGPAHFNTVHAYNRVLNDVFEDDTINAHPVREASIDVRIDAETDTFAVFSSGPQPCHGTLNLELTSGNRKHEATVALDVPRLGNRELSIRGIFPDLSRVCDGILKIEQPTQFLFYGRMLTGTRKDDGAISANHSYYDSSETMEYWDNSQPSYRLYPMLPELENIVRMYPIMSPGRLILTLDLHGGDGRKLNTQPIGAIDSPGDIHVEFSVNTLAAKSGIDPGDVAAFAFRATPMTGNTPMRINHQLVHRTSDKEGLAASVNVSLNNPNVFTPVGKTGFAWGQTPVGGNVATTLGFVGNNPDAQDADIRVTLYCEAGELCARDYTLPGGGSLCFNVERELSRLTGRNIENLLGDKTANVWYTATSPRPDLTGFAVTRHRISGHCSGEHSF